MENHTISVIVASTLAKHFDKTGILSAKNKLVESVDNYVTRIIACTIFVLLIVIRMESKKCKMPKLSNVYSLPSPPGPAGVPLLGYVPFIGHKAHETFAQLANIYGPIYKILLGAQPVVVLTDYKLIREALKSASFTQRPVLRMLSKVIQNYGLVNINGHKWIDQRQFVAKAMREMGLARTGPNRARGEAKMAVIINEMIEDIHTYEEAPVDLSTHMSECIGRILLKTLWDFDLPLGDESLKANIERAEAGFKTSLTNLVNYFPILAMAPNVKKDLNFIRQSHKQTHEFFKELVQKHKNQLQAEKEDGGNMIDWFSNRTAESNKYCDDTQLLSILAELFSAGLETTKTTLLWVILYVTLDQEVQDLIHEELDQVVGPGCRPSLDDVPSLPYLNAVIMETQRMASITPSGLVHVASEDTSVGGYYIPQGTEIIAHQWTLHHDPSLWKSPDKFDPTHFLDDQGNLIKPPYFIPFSTGRRMCLGHELATKNLFLVFASLIHEFKFTFQDGTEPSTEPVIGFTLTPSHYKVRATARDSF